MHSSPQFTRSALWMEFVCVGTIIFGEISWWGGQFFLRAIIVGGNRSGCDFPPGKLSLGGILQGAIIHGAIILGAIIKGSIFLEDNCPRTNGYYRRWLSIPVSRNITHLTLPKSKLGLSIKTCQQICIKCKIGVLRTLKTLLNEGIRNLYKLTSTKNLKSDSILGKDQFYQKTYHQKLIMRFTFNEK